MVLGYEFKKGGCRVILNIAIETLRSRIFKEYFWVVSLTMSIVDTIVGILAYYYVALFVQDAMERYVSAYGVSYAEYLLIGLMAGVIATFLRYSLYEAVYLGYWACETDLYITSPIGLKGMLIGHMMFIALWESVILATYTLAALVLGIPLHLENLPQIVLAILVASLPMIGIGLVSASDFTLFNAKRGSMTGKVFSILQRIFGGYYFPVGILPQQLHIVSYLLPHTYFYEAVRIAAFKGVWITQKPELLYPLIIQGIILLLLGALLMKKAMDKAEETGDLSRWT